MIPSLHFHLIIHFTLVKWFRFGWQDWWGEMLNPLVCTSVQFSFSVVTLESVLQCSVVPFWRSHRLSILKLMKYISKFACGVLECWLLDFFEDSCGQNLHSFYINHSTSRLMNNFCKTRIILSKNAYFKLEKKYWKVCKDNRHTKL